MTNALRADEYILPESNVVSLDGIRGPVETPSAVLANPDALQPEKKLPGRPKGSKSKGKPKKARAKKSKPAVVPSAADAPEASTHPAVGSHAPGTSTRIAPSGEGMWERARRVHPDVWWLILAGVTALALGSAIAFAVVR